MSIEDLRRPEYTGANRCWPCTAVNLAVVGVLAALVAARNRRLTGLAVALLGAGAVAVRGYVVPYTPAFAPRLVAALPLPDDLFAKGGDRDVAERESLTATEVDGETVLRELATAGALAADGELIRPTAAVDEAWYDEMDRLADLSPDALAREASDSLPTAAGAEAYVDDGEWVAVDGKLVARPVVVAELAAYRALGETDVSPDVRLTGARAFRMFLDRCPACDSELAESSEVSCCGGYTDPGTAPDDLLVCPTCEQRIYTFPS